MLLSSPPHFLLLLTLAAQALTASDPSTPILPRATAQDSTTIPSNSVLPTTLTTMTITAAPNPNSISTTASVPGGQRLKERCYFFCSGNAMALGDTVTSSTATVWKTVHDRDAVATLSPGRGYVERDQDKVAVESGSGRLLPGGRRVGGRGV